MTPEWTGPTPQEILQGVFQAEKTSEQIMDGLDLVNKGIREGEIRIEISCWDNVRGFFEMANRFYVENEGMMLTDAELGIHTAKCGSPICKKLGKAYFEVLSQSTEADSEKLTIGLQKLAEDIMLGEPRPDMEGMKSMFYDSETGAELFEVRVVDITDKCIVDEEEDRAMREATNGKREVLLCYIPYSDGMMCDIKENYGGSGISLAFNITRELASDMKEALERRASILGIDFELLQATILANAPQIKLLK